MKRMDSPGITYTKKYSVDQRYDESYKQCGKMLYIIREILEQGTTVNTKQHLFNGHNL